MYQHDYNRRHFLFLPAAMSTCAQAVARRMSTDIAPRKHGNGHRPTQATPPSSTTPPSCVLPPGPSPSHSPTRPAPRLKVLVHISLAFCIILLRHHHTPPLLARSLDISY